MKPKKITAKQGTEYYYQVDPIHTKAGELGSNSIWVGSGAAALGLNGQVDQETFGNLLNGMSPDGTTRFVGKESGPQAHSMNAATDIPLTCPKSFSVGSLFDPELREAIQTAALQTVNEVERHVFGRVTNDGVTEQVPGQMIAGLFAHGLSRANDIHEHLHLAILNMVIRPDGSFGTMENRELFRSQNEITQTFYSYLAAEAKNLGYGIELRGGSNGQVIPELAGFRGEVNKMFSKRNTTIHSADELKAKITESMPHLTPEALEALVQLRTKDSKSHDLREEDVIRSHTDQLQAIGLTPEKYLSELREAGTRQATEVGQERLSAADYIRIAVEDANERESVFSKSVIADAVRLSVGEQTRPKLEHAFNAMVKHGLIIQYSENSFTTPAMEAMEHGIIERVVAGRQSFAPLMSAEDASQAMRAYETAHGITMTQGQAESVTLALTTPDLVSATMGKAGSGKSLSYAAVMAALEDRDDVKVIGLAFQGKAASVIEASTNIPSQTIDSFLNEEQKENPKGIRQLWIVDEAGMIGSRHLDSLMIRAEQSNAQILLVGDTSQIAPLKAGKILSELDRLSVVNSTTMTEMLRQKTEYSREVADLLRNHELESAFNVLSREGKIVELEDRDARLTSAADKYVSTIAAEGKPLAMTLTNADRQDLITEIRERQKEAGQIGLQDVQVATREPVPLSGAARRMAFSYEAGNMVIVNEAIGALSPGQEASILESNLQRNSIVISDQQGNTTEIQLREDGGRLSQFREREANFSVHERGIFLKNDNSKFGRFHGIKNGVTFDIVDINESGQATIRLENGHVISKNLNGESVDNGQAITVDRAQGMSEHTAILIMPSDAPALLNENRNYVAMTRHSNDLFLITDNTERLIEAVQGEQYKTSTIDHLTDERLADLKAAVENLQRYDMSESAEAETSSSDKSDEHHIHVQMELSL